MQLSPQDTVHTTRRVGASIGRQPRAAGLFAREDGSLPARHPTLQSPDAGPSPANTACPWPVAAGRFSLTPPARAIGSRRNPRRKKILRGFHEARVITLVGFPKWTYTTCPLLVAGGHNRAECINGAALGLFPFPPIVLPRRNHVSSQCEGRPSCSRSADFSPEKSAGVGGMAIVK